MGYKKAPDPPHWVVFGCSVKTGDLLYIAIIPFICFVVFYQRYPSSLYLYLHCPVVVIVVTVLVQPLLDKFFQPPPCEHHLLLARSSNERDDERDCSYEYPLPCADVHASPPFIMREEPGFVAGATG